MLLFGDKHMTEHVRNLRFYLDMDIKFLTHHKGPVSIEAATRAEPYQLSKESVNIVNCSKMAVKLLVPV